MKRIFRTSAFLLAAVLLLSLAGDGKTHLKFQIWDVAQRDSMQAICDAYTAKNPDVVIEVQVTSWNEYWTKLEAAAESNTMPDIFWMHTNQILYYADFGMLADVTMWSPTTTPIISLKFPSATPRAATAGCTACPRTRTTSSWSTTRRCSTPPGWPTPTRTGPGTTW